MQALRSRPQQCAGGRPCARRSRQLVMPVRSAFALPNFGSTRTSSGGGGGSSSTDARGDLTANVLRQVMLVALQSRLRDHQGIKIDVVANAMDIFNGKFGGMTVQGQRWRTPLQLTAERIEVSVGEMLLDYSALVMEQKVAMNNIPTGTVSITLTAADLGNFVVHQILAAPGGPTSTAVQGKAFIFDKSSVKLQVDPRTKEGSVYLEGEWEGDGSVYLVKMTPSGGVSRKELEQHAANASARGGFKAGGSVHPLKGVPPMPPPAKLRMKAMRVDPDPVPSAGSATPTPTTSASTPSPSSSSSNSSSSSAAGEALAMAAAAANKARKGPCNSVVVEEGLAAFFTDLHLDLQGIELSKPSLSLLLQPALPGAHAPSAGGGPTPADTPMLTITMAMRLLSVPPLDMKF